MPLQCSWKVSCIDLLTGFISRQQEVTADGQVEAYCQAVSNDTVVQCAGVEGNVVLADADPSAYPEQGAFEECGNGSDACQSTRHMFGSP